MLVTFASVLVHLLLVACRKYACLNINENPMLFKLMFTYFLNLSGFHSLYILDYGTAYEVMIVCICDLSLCVCVFFIFK